MTLHFLEVKINVPFTHGSKVETLGGQRQNEPKVVSSNLTYYSFVLRFSNYDSNL